MNNYKVSLSIWPYSGVARPWKGSLVAVEQPHRGASEVDVNIKATDFENATYHAQALIAGVMLDERVWQVQLRGIVEVR